MYNGLNSLYFDCLGDISRTWLESTCVKFNWLDMICILGPTIPSACRTKNQAAKPKELDHCNQVVLRRRCGKGCKTVSKAGYLFPGARCAPSLWNGKNWEPPRQTQWQGKKGLGQRGSHCNTFGKKNYKNVFSLVIVGCVKNKVNLINSKLNLQHNKVWNKWRGLKTFQSHFTVFELCSYCFLP